MQENPYQFKRPTIEISYDFKSISQEKEVEKRVVFSTSDYQSIYNLALVDVLEDGTLSDIVETRNKDMKTVLATVVRIVEDFLNINPQNIVIFKGTDERRQRLYRLLIGRELTKIEERFCVFGGVKGNSKPQLFQRDVPYDYFIITKIKT